MQARFAMLIMLSTCAPAQSLLTITSPVDKAIVHPGETVVVDLSVSGSPLTAATIVPQDPIRPVAVLAAPPYRFLIAIPAQIRPGLYALTAEGVSPSSPMFSSDPISIDVERPDSPQKITAHFQSSELSVGMWSEIQVSGTYPDGSVVDLSRSTRTQYVSQAPRIATVSNAGLVTGVAPGSAVIIVNGTLLIPITVEPAIRIRLQPTEATLKAGQTREFVASVNDPKNPDIVWSLSPNLGTVVNGLYAAPAALDSRQKVILTAASAADPKLAETAVINLSPEASVSIVPAYAVLYGAQTQKFSAIAANAGNAGLRWSISPSDAGTIDAGGLYTAPSVIPKLQSVKITATSVANPSISGSTTIYTSPQPFVLFFESFNVRVAQGASQTIKVSVLATDRFWHPIALSARGLPPGVTAAFAQPTIKGNSKTPLTFTISAKAARKKYTVTVVARDTIVPTLSQSQTLTLIIGRRSR
jgi:Bacterial Ig-like domain (group 2)